MMDRRPVRAEPDGPGGLLCTSLVVKGRLLRMMCSCLQGATCILTGSSRSPVCRRWLGLHKMCIAQLPAGGLQQRSGKGAQGCLQHAGAGSIGRESAAGSLLAPWVEVNKSGAEGIHSRANVNSMAGAMPYWNHSADWSQKHCSGVRPALQWQLRLVCWVATQYVPLVNDAHLFSRDMAEAKSPAATCSAARWHFCIHRWLGGTPGVGAMKAVSSPGAACTSWVTSAGSSRSYRGTSSRDEGHAWPHWATLLQFSSTSSDHLGPRWVDTSSWPASTTQPRSSKS